MKNFLIIVNFKFRRIIQKAKIMHLQNQNE